MKNVIIVALCLITISAKTQSRKKQDKEAIKTMCGCYEVAFNFSETFAPDKSYEFHKNYNAKALEWVQLVDDKKDKVSLQHLLIVGDDMIVKHWRQDWLYQNTSFHIYDKDRKWKHIELTKRDVKGQWTQKVFQVDDSPRYEGSASWVHVDGRHFWENTTDSPLPRREASKRKDYNVMVRTNRHELTDDGWVHEQDNDKVIREADKGDVLLAEEKGWNTYKRVDNDKCKAAQEWWNKNEQYWSDVRKAWDLVYGYKEPLAFKRRVDNKMMYKRIFDLGDELIRSEDYDSQSVQTQMVEIINAYKN